MQLSDLPNVLILKSAGVIRYSKVLKKLQNYADLNVQQVFSRPKSRREVWSLIALDFFHLPSPTYENIIVSWEDWQIRNVIWRGSN